MRLLRQRSDKYVAIELDGALRLDHIYALADAADENRDVRPDAPITLVTLMDRSAELVDRDRFFIGSRAFLVAGDHNAFREDNS